MHDAARALQFVRSMAKEWNIDRRVSVRPADQRGCSSLWLAFHDDMADRASKDPVARESTRLWCAAVVSPQTTLDPAELKEWTPNSQYGGHAFGFMDAKTLITPPQFDEFLAHREELLPWIKEYSPYEHVSADDPPIYMIFEAPPGLGQAQKDPTHTANFGVKLREHCQSLDGLRTGLSRCAGCETQIGHAYLIETLNGRPFPHGDSDRTQIPPTAR